MRKIFVNLTERVAVVAVKLTNGPRVDSRDSKARAPAAAADANEVSDDSADKGSWAHETDCEDEMVERLAECGTAGVA